MNTFNKKILEGIGKKLLKKKESIAVAESVTSGLLQLAFSCIPDAACFFQGGITAYNIAQKFKHLEVEPLHALSVNCVSPKVAKEMGHACLPAFFKRLGNRNYRLCFTSSGIGK
ncbi:MAG: CinA family protein [Bacteroidota bacterium]